MTTCLLCPSPAVSDGLWVADGARLWAARMQQLLIECASLSGELQQERAKALREMAPTGAPDAFLSRFDAARAEQKRAENERIQRRDGAT